MSKAYGETLLVLWNRAEVTGGLELDPSRWKWAPEGSRHEIAEFSKKIREFHARKVPLTFYRPRRRS